MEAVGILFTTEGGGQRRGGGCSNELISRSQSAIQRYQTSYVMGAQTSFSPQTPAFHRSQDRSVTVYLCVLADLPSKESRQICDMLHEIENLGIFLFITAVSRPALGPTQPSIQWV
jgi:hypothetical protein